MPRLGIAAFLALLLTPAVASAGPINWPEGDGVILGHPPNQLGGPAADTEFINDSGMQSWQREADDFMLPNAATLRRVSWYGFYGGTFDPPPEPPPTIEEMRIRFYNARPSDGLPGDVLFEESFLNPMRMATGESVIVGYPHPEYLYQVDLSTPFALASNTPYWLEIVQIGNLDSHIRWETSAADLNGRAVINPFVPDWQPVGTSDLAFQLLSIPESATLNLFAVGALAVTAKLAPRQRTTEAQP